MIITTSYRGPTDNSGSKINARSHSDGGGFAAKRITVPYRPELNSYENHKVALNALCKKNDWPIDDWQDDNWPGGYLFIKPRWYPPVAKTTVMLDGIEGTSDIMGIGVNYIFTYWNSLDGEIGPVSCVEYPESGLIFTTPDWQVTQPKTVAEIADFDWVGQDGNPAVMIAGMPARMID